MGSISSRSTKSQMSIERVSSTSTRSKSSSVSGTYRPFSSSNARTMSSSSTCLPVSLRTLSYPIGTRSSLWTKWKRSSFDSVAENMRTGTLTSPKLIVPLQIGRGIGLKYPFEAVENVVNTPVNIVEYERLAEEKLDPGAFGYFAGGAGDEITLRANVEAFQRLGLRPRVLADVSGVTTSTTVLGTEVSMPLLVAPVAFQRLAHPDGELATARAAAGAGTIFCLSTVASASPAEIAEAAPDGVRWFQLYVFKDRGFTRELLARAAAAGFSAVLLTADTPHLGRRELDGVPATIDVLPEVVETVAARVPILIDGGIRRGTDIVKALALGAQAVLAGRPFIWGLAVGGEDGVSGVFELLRAELELALGLLGCRSPAKITPAHVSRL